MKKETHYFSELILATGHSARDIFYLLHKKNITIEAKPFALGVRVEHQQALIDTIQYHGDGDNPYLPPASYALVEQVDGLGVILFLYVPRWYYSALCHKPKGSGHQWLESLANAIIPMPTLALW